MNKLKQHLLQACINHGSIKAKMLDTILSDLCEQYGESKPSSNAEIKTLIDEIESEIRQFGQNLKFIKHPLTSEEFLVFAIIKMNPACKFMPQYTDSEKHLFNMLLEAAFTKLNEGVENAQLYGLNDSIVSNTQQQISKQRVMQLKDLWLSQGYFVEKDDKMYLGPRAMLEYDRYWQQRFPDCLSTCPLCYRNIYWGIECLDCETKLHRECIRKFLVKSSKCPQCGKLWMTPLN